jgi:hypothetical protein
MKSETAYLLVRRGTQRNRDYYGEVLLCFVKGGHFSPISRKTPTLESDNNHQNAHLPSFGSLYLSRIASLISCLPSFFVEEQEELCHSKKNLPMKPKQLMRRSDCSHYHFRPQHKNRPYHSR